MFGSLAAFETRVQLRRASYRTGVLLLALAPLAALLIEGGRHAIAFLGYGYFATVALRLNIGMAEDRQSGHDLLMSNFASPCQRVAAKLVALFAREALVFTLLLLVATLVWDGARTGMWFTLQFTLITCLLLPLAVTIELTTGMRSPGAVAMLLAFALTLIAVQYADATRVLEAIGVTRLAGDFTALRRLLAWSTAAMLLTLFICSLWALARREMRV